MSKSTWPFLAAALFLALAILMPLYLPDLPPLPKVDSPTLVQDAKLVFSTLKYEVKYLKRKGLVFTTLFFEGKRGGNRNKAIRENVFMLHGGFDNALTFHRQVAYLVEAGYHVWLPTMRGYEPSSIPQDGDYYLTSYVEDVFAWMDFLKIKRAHLVGHGFGAAVAAEAGRLELPFFPEWWLRQEHGLDNLWNSANPNWTISDDDPKPVEVNTWRKDGPEDVTQMLPLLPSVHQSVQRTFHQPGVLTAALGFQRCLFRSVLLPSFLLPPQGIRTKNYVWDSWHQVSYSPIHGFAGLQDGYFDGRLPQLTMSQEFAQFTLKSGGRARFSTFAANMIHQQDTNLINAYTEFWLNQYSGAEDIVIEPLIADPTWVPDANAYTPWKQGLCIWSKWFC